MKFFTINKEEKVEITNYYEYTFDEDILQDCNDDLKKLFTLENASVPFKELTLEDCFNIIDNRADGWLVEDIHFTYISAFTHTGLYEYTSTVANIVRDWILKDIYDNSNEYEQEYSDAYDIKTEITVAG